MFYCYRNYWSIYDECYAIIDYTVMDLAYSNALRDFSADRVIDTTNLSEQDNYYLIFISDNCDGLVSVEPVLK